MIPFFKSTLQLLVRNKQALYFSLILPIVMMLIFGLVAGDAKLANGMTYKDFVIPGLIVLAVLQTSIFSAAFVITQYKEKGVLKKLLTTPMKPSDFMLGQISARALISVMQVLLLISVAVLFLSFTVHGSYLLLLLIAAVGTAVFLSLGLIISGLAKKIESVPAIANMTVLPLLFLGDVFFPLEVLPRFLERIARILPVPYFAQSYREIMLFGAGIGDVWTDILMLTVWLIVFTAIASKVFSFSN